MADYIVTTNPEGNTQLVTNLVIKAKYYGADGKAGSTVTIGTAASINPSERRNITYNFVIGNSDPSTARDLIPSPIQSSTIRIDYVALMLKNAAGVFTGASDGTVPSQQYQPTIRHQVYPFDIIETWSDPSRLDSSGKPTVVWTVTYGTCYIESYDSTRDIARGDIRVMENVTVHYKTVTAVAGAPAA